MKQSRTAFQLGLLLVIVVPLALFARWQWGNREWGANFLPHPDSLEYAAGAQSLAGYGEYFLQIGPHRFPPRYPPGWPLILSLAVRAGMPGTSLWHITGLFGALLSFLLAASAYAGVRFLFKNNLSSDGFEGPWIGFGAGLTAGLVWAFAPLPVFVGQTALSDEPCLCLSMACILTILIGIGQPAASHSNRLWLLLGGFLLGLVTSMRFVNALLLALPIALICQACGTRPRWPTVLRRLTWVGLGAISAVALVSFLTDQMPWQWSGYAFWIPRWYSRLSDTFNLAYAVSGNPAYYEQIGAEATPHLLFGLKVLLGVPGFWSIAYIGKLWPIAGWLAMGAIFFKIRRLGLSGEKGVRLMMGMAIWVMGHLVLFSLYFYRSPRFYLAPMAVCLVAFAVGCALLAASTWFRKTIALAFAAAVLVATLGLGQKIPPPPELRAPYHDVLESFSHWVNAGDIARGGRPVPFDLVHAQALGLYTPQNMARISEWGQLPRQPHVIRLLEGGWISPEEVVNPQVTIKGF